MKKDATVIGGGPAGCSAALGLLKAGYNVTLYDQNKTPPQRACGGFLNPEAVHHLKWLRVYQKVQTVSPVRVDHCFISTNFNQQTRVKVEGLGLPRQQLESILLEAVKNQGGNVIQGTRHSTAENLMIYADGRHSMTRRKQKKKKGWFGWNAVFKGVRKSPGDLSLHFVPGGYVGLLTFADGHTNVSGLIHKKESTSWDETLNGIRHQEKKLDQALMKATRVTPWRGVGPLPHHVGYHKTKPALLLAGDAAATGDPFMGEGIGRALGAGPMLYKTMKEGGNVVERYKQLWRQSYSTRLWLGAAARFILQHKMVYHPAMRMLMNKEGRMESLTPFFHVGFSKRSVS